MFKNIIATAFLAFFVLVGNAQAEDPIYTSLFSSKAVGGYDTVSYFQGNGVPVEGSEDFHTEYQGADWYFSSKANLDKFLANPTKYAPQYGGYCAWAAAHGTLAKGDPKTYELVNGKLYLNYDKSIHDKWAPRKAELIAKADDKFADLIEE